MKKKPAKPLSSQLKTPGPLPEPIRTAAEGLSVAGQLLQDRDAPLIPNPETREAMQEAEDIVSTRQTRLSSWDPSWLGTRCPACGHLHPTTAERVATLSRTCCACGAPMRSIPQTDEPKPIRFGQLKGDLTVPGDFDEPLDVVQHEAKRSFLHIPDHPGSYLLIEFMPNGIRRVPGVSAQTILDLVLGEGRITPRLASKLAADCDTTAEFWIKLQTDHDAYLQGLSAPQESPAPSVVLDPSFGGGEMLPGLAEVGHHKAPCLTTKEKLLAFREDAGRYGGNPSLPSDVGQVLDLQEARLLAVALLLETEPEALLPFLDRLVFESDLSVGHLDDARNEAGVNVPVFSKIKTKPAPKRP